MNYNDLSKAGLETFFTKFLYPICADCTMPVPADSSIHFAGLVYRLPINLAHPPHRIYEPFLYLVSGLGPNSPPA